jgi:hypothetical protein
MKNIEEIFEATCNHNMKEFNLDEFKKSHPLLFRCILKTAKSYSENSNPPFEDIDSKRKLQLNITDEGEKITTQINTLGLSHIEKVGILSITLNGLISDKNK